MVKRSLERREGIYTSLFWPEKARYGQGCDRCRFLATRANSHIQCASRFQFLRPSGRVNYENKRRNKKYIIYCLFHLSSQRRWQNITAYYHLLKRASKQVARLKPYFRKAKDHMRRVSPIRRGICTSPRGRNRHKSVMMKCHANFEPTASHSNDR